VVIALRTTGDDAGGTLGWSSPHGSNGHQMVTGDNKLVEVQATVQYRVTEPMVYLFEVNDPDEIIRTAAESVLRGIVAGRAFQPLLTESRKALGDAALERLRERCASYKLGIQVEAVILNDLHPPRDVVEHYYAVARAMTDKDKMINEAKAEAVKTLRTAEADRDMTLLGGKVAAAQIINEAQADHDVFLAWSRARRTLGQEQEVYLACRALGDLFHGKDPVQVVVSYEKQRNYLLEMQPNLFDFRLFTEVLNRSLAGRDLLLIDTDKDRLPGRRHLLLFDPNQFRIPMPVFLQKDRDPPDRSNLDKHDGP
jgi:membrane protease subunit HflK